MGRQEIFLAFFRLLDKAFSKNIEERYRKYLCFSYLYSIYSIFKM